MEKELTAKQVLRHFEENVKNYPDTPEAVCELNKDYPHKKEEITKQDVTTKFKAVQIKFRQAVDNGGNGRMVFLYYDLCEGIWEGSPATEISSGLETKDVE